MGGKVSITRLPMLGALPDLDTLNEPQAEAAAGRLRGVFGRRVDARGQSRAFVLDGDAQAVIAQDGTNIDPVPVARQPGRVA